MDNMDKNSENIQTNQNVVKTKTNKVVIILIVILSLMVIGLSIVIVYNNFINKNGIDEESKKEEITETNKESSNIEEAEEIKSLKDNIYYLSSDNDNYYFEFINDNEYKCLIKNYDLNIQDATDYSSNGTYEFDGNNIKLSDEKIKLILDEDKLYVNINNYTTYENLPLYYDVYFNKDVIEEEFKQIGEAAQETRQTEWNNTHSEKIIRAKGNVNWCYKYENDEGKISCSITINQYFENYDQNECINNPMSVYQESVISSGECKEDYSTYWSFSYAVKEEDGYNVYGSWTGI